MRFTFSWIAEHLDFFDKNCSINSIAESLNMVGLECEVCENRADEFKDMVVAEVVSIKKVDGSDHLSDCLVKFSENEVMRLICGANNLTLNMKVIYAPPGSVIPSWNDVLETKEIMGIKSSGMIVSERELCLSDEHDGIIVLDQHINVGTPACEALGYDDPVIEIQVTPNRGDCLSIRGIARELSVAGLGNLKPLKKLQGFEKKLPESNISVEIEQTAINENVCRYFSGRYIQGVNNNLPTPNFIKKRLKSVGILSNSLIVDIINYCSHELGQPMHAYDADKICNTLFVRLLDKKTSIDSLIGKKLQLEIEDCVIADKSELQAVAGIVGAEVSKSVCDTKNIFVEAAVFEQIKIAKTGRRLGVITDSRYRFERNVDLEMVDYVRDYAVKMILDYAGGCASKVAFDGGQNNQSHRSINFDFAQVKRLLGVNLDKKIALQKLEKLGFIINGDAKEQKINLSIPSFRQDVTQDCDVVEEIARTMGGLIVPEKPHFIKDENIQGAVSNARIRIAFARKCLAVSGLSEVVTWPFVSKQEAIDYGGGAEQLSVVNPLTSIQTDMRPSLFPGLVKTLINNENNGQKNIGLFETGSVFSYNDTVIQENVVAAVRSGSCVANVGLGKWDKKDQKVGFDDAKYDMWSVMMALGLPVDKLFLGYDNLPYWMHHKKSAWVMIGHKNVVGYFGEFSPLFCYEQDISTILAGFEIFIDRIPAKMSIFNKQLKKTGLSTQYNVLRDFSFEVPNDLRAEEIIKIIKGADKKLIQDVDVFDVYHNAQRDDKVLSLSVVIGNNVSSLVDAEIEKVSQGIIRKVCALDKVRLRGT